MDAVEGVSEPTGPLYQLLASAVDVAYYINELGDDRFEQELKDEIRQAMDEHGTRVVLYYGERLNNVTAIFEEFVV